MEENKSWIELLLYHYCWANVNIFYKVVEKRKEKRNKRKIELVRKNRKIFYERKEQEE